MAIKLKACPFCGGEANVMDVEFPHWVYCKSCGARIHGWTTDEEGSVKAWNKRQLPRINQKMELPKVIEQLQSLRKNSASFIQSDEPRSIWHDDVDALETAIEILEKM